MARPPRWLIVTALGTAQTLAWASSFYLVAIVAVPMAADFRVTPAWIFGAFSAALLLSALLGPWAGRLIERRGGGPVLTLSSIVFAAGLLTLGVAPTPPLLASAPTRPDEAPARAMVLLAFAFAATWIISTAMAAHLPNLLHLAGASTTAAVAAAALVGPAQVAARLAEFAVLRKFHPLVSARVATLLHPAGAALLAVFGAPAAAGFAVLHGVGNGMLTIAKGTLPLALFGPAGYGLRSGILSAPARIARPPPRWASHGRWNAGASGHSGSR